MADKEKDLEEDVEKADAIDSEQPLTDDQLTLEQLKKSVTEDDSAPTSALTLRKILGGEILSARMVRCQVWLCLLIALFLTFYVAFRYQCQQDMIDIAQLEAELTDAKYKALSSSSTLTERCRESQVLERLRANQDSTLHTSSQPPFKIYVREKN